MLDVDQEQRYLTFEFSIEWHYKVKHFCLPEFHESQNFLDPSPQKLCFLYTPLILCTHDHV